MEQTNRILGNILTSVGIIVACSWILFESFRMSGDALEKDIAKVYTAPGLLPLIVAFLVLGLTLFVLFYYLKKISIKDIELTRTLKSIYFPALVFGQLFLYIFILIPNMPFVLSTIIFTSLFMAVFNASSILKILISSLVYSILVVYFFIKVVGVRFPVTMFHF